MNNKLWGWPLLASVVALMVPPNAVAETVDQRLETLAFGARATIDSLAQGERIEITDVQVENAATGITLWLVANGELVGTDSAIANNAVVVTIPNAELQLTDGDEFLVENPAAGIALITVTNLSNNQVQITITGTDTAPDLGISTAATGLFVNVTPSIPTAQTPDDDALRIVVTGDDDDDYFIPNASTATRTDTPLRDIPNSIQVIPRQVIEDQQATSIEEVLDNAAGISNLGNESGRGINFAIRGFSGAPVLRDGFLLPGSGPDAARPEVANLERVEVLRGPASVLYGQAEPGGVINLVTKQPLSEPYYNLQLQGGNRGFISPSVDLSGPLTDDGRLLYRLNALYRREESFRDFDNDAERFAIAPTLTWLIGDRTDLNVSLEYVEDNEFFDTGTLPFGDSIANVSPSRVFNDPDATIEQDFLRTGYTLEHRFSDNWKLRNRFNYTSTSFQYSILPFPSPPDPNGDIFRVFLQQGGDTDTYSLYTNVQGEFNTGSIEHTLLLGVDLARSESNTLSRIDFSAPSSFSPINIFDDTVDVTFPESLPILSDRDITVDQLGIYLQDQIDLLDNLILVAGLRYDTFSQETIQNLPGTELSRDESALTPRIGIVYQPIEPISLYANYSRTFLPNLTETDVNGDFLDPEEGVGFEVGIRGEIIEDRLIANLAYFDITKQNVATADPNVPFLASIATGEQRSRGVDFNLTGEILSGWNMVASYAYIDAEVTEDNDIPVGNRLGGIPEHSASLWTTYALQSGDLQGLGFGLGFNFVGEREGNIFNDFAVDSYFRTDAAVFYRRDDWQVRLNFDNLFDIDYVETTGNADNLWGDPLTVRASVEYTF